MARTKRYLTSSKTAHSGFYRPLSRLQQSSSRRFDDDEKTLIDDIRTSASELEDLQRQIARAKQLKQELTEKLHSRPVVHSYRPKLEEDDEEDIAPEPKIKKVTSFSKPPLRKPEPRRTYHDEEEELDFADHDTNEKISLLEKELQQALKREQDFKQELNSLKELLTKEHKEVDATLHTIQKDAHRTDPIENNRFFSISKELQDVVTAMNQLVALEEKATTTGQAVPAVATAQTNQIPAPVNAQTGTQSTPAAMPAASTANPAPVQAVVNSTPPTPAVTQTAPVTPTVQPAPIVQTAGQPVPEQPAKKKFPIPKPIVVLVSIILFVGLTAGGFWYFVNRKTEVNSMLVQEYLKQDSQTAQPAAEKKIDQSSQNKESNSPQAGSSAPQPETKGASDDKYKESKADVPFANTEWETMTDGSWGIEVKYPKNAVNVIKTESNITFIRKTGYIFKVQVIETALDIKEYWKLIQASSLKYKVKETTFRDKPAFFLELEDFTNFPGDRYLVKYKDRIYDIWYATYSDTLSDDDAKRIDVMLESFKFTN